MPVDSKTGVSRRGAVVTMLAVGAAGATGVRAAPAAAPQGDAARQAIDRLLGRDVASRVDLRIEGDRPDGYELGVVDGCIRIVAGSPVAAVRGVYAHLNAEGHASVSWEGDRVALPPRLSDRPSQARNAAFAHRLYLNTCTFGYTTPFWGWTEWEREIDRMAANGIDMPLALEGQEAVWQALWREQGLTNRELAGFFSGPAFLPWQRMGNIEGYETPLPQGWIDAKRVLQRRILTRMRELGMKPVLPGFAGYVPRAFADRNPGARIYRMRAWEGFTETRWLDPADPLFAKLARRFLELQQAAYGPATHFLADAFNEMVPPIADDGSDVHSTGYGDSTANSGETKSMMSAEVRAERLAAYGERLYRSMADVVPGATWVMQGWLFGADKAFWTPDAIAAFLSKIPDRLMLILDIGNDRYPGIWQKTEAFGGKGWAYGYVHNYGGSNPVYGDLGFYRRDVATLRGAETGQLTGFGMFPEGLHSNWIVYAHNYDLAYGDGEATLDAWLARYLRARYGSAEPALLRGWQAVVRGSFNTRYWMPRWWESRAGAYLFFKRPTIDAVDYPSPPGDTAALREGIEMLLAAAAGPLRGARLFVHDIAELSRHYATMRLDEALRATVKAYRDRRLAEVDAGMAKIRDMALAIDALLAGQPETLATWLGAASAYGRNDAERAIYVKNARLQVTVWGGKGNLSDYASKAWAGMYRDYYLPRWTMFLRALRAGEGGDTTLAALRRWERNWCDDPTVPTGVAAPTDIFASAMSLMRLAG